MQDKTIVFDLGAVLIDWDPRHLYRKVFDNEADMEYFLRHIATGEWNELQDAGRSLKEATEVLMYHYPEHGHHIQMYYDRWKEMLNGPIHDTVEILRSIKDQGYRILALTNWSDETFPVAMQEFEFLHWFEDILVSGREKLKKPDLAFFNLLLKRNNLDPAKTIFIDDNIRNVAAANHLGMEGIHFTSPRLLKLQLAERGVQV